MAERFGPQLNLLTELVNYTSNLIPRAFLSSKKDLRDVVVCYILLKQFAVMVDAVDTLARAGAITAAYLPARAAFEASIYIEWILVSEGAKKATYYYVGHVRAERLWGRRAAKAYPECALFVEDMKQLGEDLYTHRADFDAEGRKIISDADSVLAQPRFSEANSAFDAWLASRNKSRHKSSHEPEWYKVLGKPSLRSIAKELMRLPDYLIYYGKGSRVMHSFSTKDHVEFQKGGGAVAIRFGILRAHMICSMVS